MKIKKRDKPDLSWNQISILFLAPGVVLMGIVLAIPTLALGFQIFSMSIVSAGLYCILASRYEIDKGPQDD